MENEERRFDVLIEKCIYPDCSGELYELLYDETNNWITVVYKCSRCGREFTVKIEV
jgi:transposase-like protein